MAAYAAGQQDARNRGGSGSDSAAGALLAPLIVVFGPIALIVGTCIYPFAGALTLSAVAMVAGVMEDSHRSGLMTFLMLIPPCILFFSLGMLLEKFFERFALYRFLRHLARAAAVGFVVHVIAFQFHGAGHFDPNTSVLDRINAPHAVAVLIAVVVGFVGSMRMDAKLGNTGGFLRRFRLSRSR